MVKTIFFIKYFVHTSLRQPSLAQLVERGTVVKKFALTSQGLRFNPGTEDFTYLTFWLNVYLSLYTASAHI